MKDVFIEDVFSSIDKLAKLCLKTGKLSITYDDLGWTITTPVGSGFALTFKDVLGLSVSMLELGEWPDD